MNKKRATQPAKKAKIAAIDPVTDAAIDRRARELAAVTGRYNYSQAIAVIVREWQDAGCAIARDDKPVKIVVSQ